MHPIATIAHRTVRTHAAQPATGHRHVAGSVTTTPMTVITAAQRELSAGLAAAEVARLTESRNRGRTGWQALSANGRLVSVDDTGRHIQIDQPGVVIDEITRLLP